MKAVQGNRTHPHAHLHLARSDAVDHASDFAEG